MRLEGELINTDYIIEARYSETERPEVDYKDVTLNRIFNEEQDPDPILKRLVLVLYVGKGVENSKTYMGEDATALWEALCKSSMDVLAGYRKKRGGEQTDGEARIKEGLAEL